MRLESQIPQRRRSGLSVDNNIEVDLQEKIVSASRLDSYGIRKGTFVESCGRFKDPCVRKVHGKARVFSVVLPKS